MFSFIKKNRQEEILLYSPIDGIIEDIEKVNDPVFSEKMMGDGIAIRYQSGDVCAPVSGELITVIEPSYHAFALRTEDGLEVLVHVGLESVKLDKKCFTLLKKKGDFIKAGETILHVNQEVLLNAGIDVITPIVITNSKEYQIEKQGKSNDFATQNKTVLLSCKKK